MRTYSKQCLQNIRNVGDYLESLIQDFGEEFEKYQNYYMEHYAEIDIPADYTEYRTAYKEYLELLDRSRKDDPSVPAGFDSPDPEVRNAYFLYMQEYWYLTFENARESFGLPYTYYIVPDEETLTIWYMIDGERMYKDADGNEAESGDYIYLGFNIFNAYEPYHIEWDSWLTGERQEEFQEWDTAWGHTYSYYTPLIINGKKLGLIGTEVEVSDVNKGILQNTIRQTLGVTSVLIICLVLMFHMLHVRYIKKIRQLETDLREYSEKKNPEIANRIAARIKGNNEISSLSKQFASMIVAIEKYMQDLLSTSKELNDTKKLADEMNVLANRDSLTGIRNKTAYDNEIHRLEQKVSVGKTDFGIAMIDLNFLKQINDNYGHELGNLAIKKLCHIVCVVFDHSPVFRIGGDEFVVILENSDYENIENLVDEFNLVLSEISLDEDLEPWGKVSAAIGYALYDETLDTDVSSVFKRADKAMYDCKKKMKAERLE